IPPASTLALKKVLSDNYLWSFY
ncbi:uncharacterized protein METZ01_LOCUS449441, partial [marine metagenome]